MKILKPKRFVSERMKIVPISNDEFDKVSDFPKNILETGDIVYMDENYYVFVTYDDFIKNRLFDKVFPKYHWKNDKRLLKSIQEGLFIDDEYDNGNFGFMDMDSYDDSLRMKNGHTNFDITLIFRPNFPIDLLDDKSIGNSKLKSIVQSDNGKILFGSINEKMKVMPINNDEFDKVEEYTKPVKLLKSGDVVILNNGVLYRYLTYQDCKESGMCSKIPSEDFARYKDGIFILNIIYIYLDVYDEDLKMKNKHSDYDIKEIRRPHVIPDLSDSESYSYKKLDDDYNDPKTRKIWNNGNTLF